MRADGYCFDTANLSMQKQGGGHMSGRRRWYMPSSNYFLAKWSSNCNGRKIYKLSLHSCCRLKFLWEMTRTQLSRAGQMLYVKCSSTAIWQELNQLTKVTFRRWSKVVCFANIYRHDLTQRRSFKDIADFPITRIQPKVLTKCIGKNDVRGPGTTWTILITRNLLQKLLLLQWRWQLDRYMTSWMEVHHHPWVIQKLRLKAWENAMSLSNV